MSNKLQFSVYGLPLSISGNDGQVRALYSAFKPNPLTGTLKPSAADVLQEFLDRSGRVAASGTYAVVCVFDDRSNRIYQFNVERIVPPAPLWKITPA